MLSNTPTAKTSTGIGLLLKARPVAQVAVASVLAGLLTAAVCNAVLPSLTPDEAVYSATITYFIAPALASAIALGWLNSRMHAWENLASRKLFPSRLGLGLLVLALALAIVVPSAPRAQVRDPVLVAVQGVLMCSGLGMLASRRLPYAGQAGIAFLYGLVSLNAAWAFQDHPIGAALVIGTTPRPATLAAALLVALGGLVVQASSTPRLGE